MNELFNNIRMIAPMFYNAFIPNIAVGKNFSQIFRLNRFPTRNYLSQEKKPIFKPLVRYKPIFSMKFNDYSSEKNLLALNEKFDAEDRNWKNTIQALSPTYRRLISVLIFSSSLLSGWILSPSRNKIISVGTSALTGTLALIFIKKFNKKNDYIVKKKIVQFLNFNLPSENFSSEISLVAKEYKLNENEKKILLLDIYKMFLEILLRNHNLNIEEIIELRMLKSILSLSSQDVGECHYAYGQNLSKDYVVMAERNDLRETNLFIEKFFFLSDRIFELDSPNGYRYESARLRKIFLFQEEKVKQQCNEKAILLYKDLIERSGIITSSNPQEIIKKGEALGLPEFDRNEIHNKFLRDEVSEILFKNRKIKKKNEEYLDKVKNLLNIKEKTYNQCLEESVGSYYFELVNPILDKIKDEDSTINSKELIEILKEFQKDFLMSKQASERYFCLASQNMIYEMVEASIKNMRDKKIVESIEEIKRAVTLKKNILAIFDTLSSEKIEESSIFEIRSKFKLNELKKLYTIYLNDCLDEVGLSLNRKKNLLDFQKILGLSDKEIEEIYEITVGPIFYGKIRALLNDKNFGSDSKKVIENLESIFGIEKNYSFQIKSGLYEELLKTSLGKDEFLSEKEKKEFENFRKFLGLKWSEVQSYHDSLNETTYQKSVSEALGATGIVPINYWQGLENFRKRLQISEKKAKEIFYQSIKNKLKTGLEKAIVENKKKAQQKNSESADQGEDPTVKKGAGTALGIEAGNPAGNELLNLVDLYSKNAIFIENEKTFNKISQISLNGQSGRVEMRNSTKSRIEYSYPVTLDGVFNKKIISDLYREYLVECFSVKSQNEKRKLFIYLEKLGPILGLNTNEIGEIHSSVGSLIYKQYLAQALVKGFIDSSEMSFLSNIQATLSMSSSKCSELIRDAKKNKVSLMIENIFSTSKIDPSRVSEMRKLAKQLGIDLTKDLNVSIDQRTKMYKVVIDSEIGKGLINDKNQDIIKEIQKSLGLENELARKILIDCISSRCENQLLNSVASLRKNSLNDVVKELEKMLNFGNLFPIYIKNPTASRKERKELFSIYQSNYEESVSDDQYTSKLNLLRTMLGIE